MSKEVIVYDQASRKPQLEAALIQHQDGLHRLSAYLDWMDFYRLFGRIPDKKSNGIAWIILEKDDQQ